MCVPQLPGGGANSRGPTPSFRLVAIVCGGVGGGGYLAMVVAAHCCEHPAVVPGTRDARWPSLCALPEARRALCWLASPCHAMRAIPCCRYGCKNMVFSSSCTVYGNPQVGGAPWQPGSRAGCRAGPITCCHLLAGPPLPHALEALVPEGLQCENKHACACLITPHPTPPHPLAQYVPIDEAHPLKAVSPYGNTKLIIEDILRDLSASDPAWRIILLRYFNPVGAHPSGGLGGGGGLLPRFAAALCAPLLPFSSCS